MQIAYKEVVLSSPKDMEDARHLRELCKDVVTKTGIDHAKRFIKETTRN
jgi:poly(3-hydroxybutyrate) depolymerase